MIHDQMNDGRQATGTVAIGGRGDRHTPARVNGGQDWLAFVRQAGLFNSCSHGWPGRAATVPVSFKFRSRRVLPLVACGGRKGALHGAALRLPIQLLDQPRREALADLTPVIQGTSPLAPIDSERGVVSVQQVVGEVRFV